MYIYMLILLHIPYIEHFKFSSENIQHVLHPEKYLRLATFSQWKHEHVAENDLILQHRIPTERHTNVNRM